MFILMTSNNVLSFEQLLFYIFICTFWQELDHIASYYLRHILKTYFMSILFISLCSQAVYVKPISLIGKSRMTFSSVVLAWKERHFSSLEKITINSTICVCLVFYQQMRWYLLLCLECLGIHFASVTYVGGPIIMNIFRIFLFIAWNEMWPTTLSQVTTNLQLVSSSLKSSKYLSYATAHQSVAVYHNRVTLLLPSWFDGLKKVNLALIAIGITELHPRIPMSKSFQ